MNRQKAVSLLLLLTELAVTLFIAGIVVPSLIRSDLATNEALATGSLHAIKIAGITFSYTTKNIAFAILGASVGAMVAFAIHFAAAYGQRPRPSDSGRNSVFSAAASFERRDSITGSY